MDALDPQTLERAERHLRDEMERLTAGNPVEESRAAIRRNMETTVATPRNPDVTEHIDRLRICMKLLCNLRLNLSMFNGGDLDFRINQLRGIKKLSAFLTTGKELSGYFRQPTGAGKTVLFGIITRLLSVKTLVLVPRTNLVQQTVDEFRNVVGFDETGLGRMVGGTAQLDRPVTVATYQSHLSRMKRDPAYRAFVASCELIVCDEAHRSLGKATAGSIRLATGEDDGSEEEAGEFDDDMTEEDERAEQQALTELATTNRKALKLGFTATPLLASKDVGDHFGPCIAEERHSDMVAAGICVPYALVRVDGTVTHADLETSMTEEVETNILRRERTYGKLLDAYASTLTAYRSKQEEHGYPLRGVAFCVNIAECDAFAAEARKHGLQCEIVTGRETTGNDADGIIRAAEERLLAQEIDLIVTVKKLAEGWNFKPANAAIWARACTSPADVVQGIGRTARAYRDPEFGYKKESLVFETAWELRGTKGKPRSRRPVGIADALARNGEDPTLVCHHADGTLLDYTKQLTTEELRMLITTNFTPQQWAGMKGAEIRALKIGPEQMGLYAVATLFGVEGNPGNHSVHLVLGKAIWGEAWKDPEAERREELRTLITADYTPVQWVGMKSIEKHALKIGPEQVGLKAVATLFGVEGNPLGNHSFHLALGSAIWGEGWNDPETEQREELLTLIMADYTPDQWAEMKAAEKRKLKIGPEQMGLNALATLFGVEGNPVRNHPVHLALGKAIWEEAWKDPETWDTEKIRTWIQEKYTPQGWAEMLKTEKNVVKIGPEQMGLNAMATLFGVEGNPIANHSVHLALGKAIWEERWIE